MLTSLCAEGARVGKFFFGETYVRTHSIVEDAKKRQRISNERIDLLATFFTLHCLHTDIWLAPPVAKYSCTTSMTQDPRTSGFDPLQ